LQVGNDVPWRELDRVIAEWQPAQLVVGVPQGAGAAQIAAQIRDFIAALGRRYALPVATVDETLTSAAARAELSTNRRSGYLRRRVGKGRTDRVAACLIAEQWMNER
jgi:putative Holliday junction resolvase